MKVKFRNLKTTGVELRLIPSLLGISDLGTQTGSVVKDGEVVNIYLDKYLKPTISCADATSGISFASANNSALLGKRIVAEHDDTTTSLDIDVNDTNEILNLINVTFQDIFSLVLRPDNIWVFDITGKNDVKVSIYAIEDGDLTLKDWVQTEHIDPNEVNIGLNPTLIQDIISINFCMTPSLRCEPNRLEIPYSKTVSWTNELVGLRYALNGGVDSIITLNDSEGVSDLPLPNAFLKLLTRNNSPNGIFTDLNTNLRGGFNIIDTTDTYTYAGVEGDGEYGRTIIFYRAKPDDNLDIDMFDLLFGPDVDVFELHTCAENTTGITCVGSTDHATLVSVLDSADAYMGLKVYDISLMRGTQELATFTADFGADDDVFKMNLIKFFSDWNIIFNPKDNSIINTVNESIQIQATNNSGIGQVENYIVDVLGTDSFQVVPGHYFNLCLTPGTSVISCEGALAYTSEISLDGAIGLAFDSGDYVEYNTPDELITALKAKGLDVEVITDPEPPVEELTEILMDNNAIAVPLDGSKKYVMNATVIHNGVEKPAPISTLINSPPFMAGMLDHDPIVMLLWFMNLPQNPDFANLEKWFTSDLLAMQNPAEGNNLPHVNFKGNKQDEVSVVDKIQIRFEPVESLNADEVDYYSLILNSRYPDGVTVTSFGQMKSTNIDKGYLSDNDTTFAYRGLSQTRSFGLRQFDPITLASTELELIPSQAVMDAENVGLMYTSKDGSIVVGTIDSNNATDVVPVYGWSINGQTTTSLEFTINDGIEIPKYAMRIAISPDNKRIIAAMTPENDIYVFDQSPTNPLKYICNNVIKPYSVIETGMLDVNYVGNQLVTRGYTDSGVAYYAVDLVDNGSGLVANILSTTAVEYTGGYVMSESVAIHGTGMLDSVKGKLVYIDFSNPEAITSKVVWTYPNDLPVSGELDAETVYFTKVDSNVKAIYSVIGRQSANTTVFDWNDTTKEVSNEKTRIDDIRVNSLNKFSNSKGVICFVYGNAIANELILQINSENELTEVTLPLSP